MIQKRGSAWTYKNARKVGDGECFTLVEMEGAHERTHCMRKGGLERIDDGRTGLEVIGCRASNKDRVTDHLVRIGGRASGLDAKLWALKQVNVDMEVLQYMKLMKVIHTRYDAG